MHSFTEKKHLIQELLNLSTLRHTSVYTKQIIPDKLKPFISQRSEFIAIPKEQIAIFPTKAQNLKALQTPTSTKSVRIELNNVNLKELINYAHQLESLHPNLKVVSMDIIENEEKTNYFNAVYTLSLFFLTANSTPNKSQALKKVY